MPACEKCWADAFAIARARGEYQVEVYRELLTERDTTGHVCTREEQRGES